jgi:hypothetical protein
MATQARDENHHPSGGLGAGVGLSPSTNGTAENDSPSRREIDSVARFLPRFSLRTLAIVVTLICAYFGAWGPTRKFATAQPATLRFADDRELLTTDQSDEMNEHMRDALRKKSCLVLSQRMSAPAPLILARKETKHDLKLKADIANKRCYYLWLFGPKVRLPIESDW